MWRDPMVVSTFTHVLAEEDKLAKTITRKKVYAELFKSKAFETFRITAELKYSSYSRIKNDTVNGKGCQCLKRLGKWVI